MLRVIAAGLPRTGTFSLKQALERLGYGPSYHMVDVFARPDHVSAWRGAQHTEPDWDALFTGYVSVTDTPACLFWRQLAAKYPQAPVVLTVREAESWYQSFAATVFVTMTQPDLLPEAARPAIIMACELVLDQFFGGQFANRQAAIERYHRHNAEVAALGSRVLVYDLSAGWTPLCKFLGVAIPEDPFPHMNTRERFRARVGLE
jgi:Sulfotransferase domain